MADINKSIQEEEQIHALALMRVEGIGPVTARTLCESLNSFKEVFHLSPTALRARTGCTDVMAARIAKFNGWKAVEDDMNALRKNQVQMTHYFMDSFPERLKQCADAPLYFFRRGDIDLNKQRVVGVVGTRRPSSYGISVCQQLVTDLTKYKPVILSGLAYGIDICAHRAGIKSDLPGVACLAHGLDRIYPREHADVAAQLTQNGMLISEYLPGVMPDRENFPMRNRLIAGLCDALVVVESGVRGGSMITAKLGFNYNRDVFAFPGRNIDASSAGCNFLIKSNQATLIESAADIVDGLSWATGSQLQLQIETIPQSVIVEEQSIIKSLLKGTRHFDDLSLHTGLSPGLLSYFLLELELKKMVVSMPGKHFELNYARR